MTWLKATAVLVAGMGLGSCTSTGEFPATPEGTNCSPPSRIFRVASAEVQIADAESAVWRGPRLQEGHYAVLMKINGGVPSYTGFGTGVEFKTGAFVPTLVVFTRDPRSDWYEDPLPKHETEIGFFEVSSEGSPTSTDDEWYRVFAPGADNWSIEVWQLPNRSGLNCRLPELTRKSEFPSRS